MPSKKPRKNEPTGPIASVKRLRPTTRHTAIVITPIISDLSPLGAGFFLLFARLFFEEVAKKIITILLIEFDLIITDGYFKFNAKNKKPPEGGQIAVWSWR